MEELLAIPNREVAGAPNLTVVEQDGLDLRVRVWAPGAGLTTVRTVSGAVKSTDAAVFPVLAPTGDRILLFLLGGGATGSGGSNDRARLIDRAGKVLWTGTDLAAQSVVSVANEVRAVEQHPLRTAGELARLRPVRDRVGGEGAQSGVRLFRELRAASSELS